MTPLQRLLRDAYLEADKKVSLLTGSKPDIDKVPQDDSDEAFTARQTHREAMFTWRAEFNAALGYCEGMRKACVLAEVPNFKDD